MMKPIFFLVLLCFGPVSARAGEIMFEGYYKINLENKPIGYLIQRYEFDPKSKHFLAISFQRAKLGGKIVQESLKAVSNDKFEPVSYQFTAQIGDEMKVIDGSFKGNIMNLNLTDGKKTMRHETHKIPSGTFLSSFLVYVMLHKKLAINDVFKYSAVAEEEGSSAYGKSWLESKEEKGGHTVFRVLNTYLGDKYASSLAVVPDPKNPDHYIKGEVLATLSPAKNISTELVANPMDATEGQLVPNKVLILLFGSMPTGKLNMISQPLAQSQAQAAAAQPQTQPSPSPPPKMIPSPVPPAEPPPEKPGK